MFESRRLHHPFHYPNIEPISSEKKLQTIVKHCGQPIDGSAVYRRAALIFGSWANAPNEANISSKLARSQSQLQVFSRLLESLSSDDKQVAEEICELLLTDSKIDSLEEAITKLAQGDLSYRLRATDLFNELTCRNKS